MEILIIDDNSENERISKNKASDGLSGIPNIKIIENPSPRNASRARNIGLDNACGEWITFLDDDDAYHPDKIQMQMELIFSKEADVVLCRACYHLKKRARTKPGSGVYRGDQLLMEAFLTTPCLLHKKTKHIRFDESCDAGEDALYFQDLLEEFKSDKVYSRLEALVDVYPQPGTRVNVNGPAHARTALKIFHKHGARYSMLATEKFLDFTRLQKLKLSRRGTGKLLCFSVYFTGKYGFAYWRPLLNAICYKIPVLRPFIVS